MLSTIAFHYWTLGQLLRCLPPKDEPHSHFLRSFSVLIILVAAHVVEILWFALGLYSAGEKLDLGRLTGFSGNGFMDYFYHSAATYTTLGLSQVPTDHLRFITAMEALTGIIILTWSATFFYSVMGREPEQ